MMRTSAATIPEDPLLSQWPKDGGKRSEVLIAFFRKQIDQAHREGQSKAIANLEEEEAACSGIRWDSGAGGEMALALARANRLEAEVERLRVQGVARDHINSRMSERLRLKLAEAQRTPAEGSQCAKDAVLEAAIRALATTARVLRPMVEEADEGEPDALGMIISAVGHGTTTTTTTATGGLFAALMDVQERVGCDLFGAIAETAASGVEALRVSQQGAVDETANLQDARTKHKATIVRLRGERDTCRAQAERLGGAYEEVVVSERTLRAELAVAKARYEELVAHSKETDRLYNDLRPAYEGLEKAYQNLSLKLEWAAGKHVALGNKKLGECFEDLQKTSDSNASLASKAADKSARATHRAVALRTENAKLHVRVCKLSEELNRFRPSAMRAREISGELEREIQGYRDAGIVPEGEDGRDMLDCASCAALWAANLHLEEAMEEHVWEVVNVQNRYNNKVASHKARASREVKVAQNATEALREEIRALETKMDAETARLRGEIAGREETIASNMEARDRIVEYKSGQIDDKDNTITALQADLRVAEQAHLRIERQATERGVEDTCGYMALQVLFQLCGMFADVLPEEGDRFREQRQWTSGIYSRMQEINTIRHPEDGGPTLSQGEYWNNPRVHALFSELSDHLSSTSSDGGGGESISRRFVDSLDAELRVVLHEPRTSNAGGGGGGDGDDDGGGGAELLGGMDLSFVDIDVMYDPDAGSGAYQELAAVLLELLEPFRKLADGLCCGEEWRQPEDLALMRQLAGQLRETSDAVVAGVRRSDVTTRSVQALKYVLRQKLPNGRFYTEWLTSQAAKCFKVNDRFASETMGHLVKQRAWNAATKAQNKALVGTFREKLQDVLRANSVSGAPLPVEDAQAMVRYNADVDAALETMAASVTDETPGDLRQAIDTFAASWAYIYEMRVATNPLPATVVVAQQQYQQQRQYRGRGKEGEQGGSATKRIRMDSEELSPPDPYDPAYGPPSPTYSGNSTYTTQ